LLAARDPCQAHLSRSGISSRDPKGAGIFFFGGEVGRARPTVMMMDKLKSMITITANESYSDDPY
jgi:hypothetical protein